MIYTIFSFDGANFIKMSQLSILNAPTAFSLNNFYIFHRVIKTQENVFGKIRNRFLESFEAIFTKFENQQEGR